MTAQPKVGNYASFLVMDARQHTLAYGCGVCQDVKFYRAISEGWPTTRDLEIAWQRAQKCCTCIECGELLRRGEEFESENVFTHVCKTCGPAVHDKREAEIAEGQTAWKEQQRKLHESMANCPDPHAAHRLLSMMENISEDYYAAGWMIGLEDELWAMAQGGDRRFGLGEIPETDVTILKELSTACDGWWRWNDGREFVRLADWKPRDPDPVKESEPDVCKKCNDDLSPTDTSRSCTCGKWFILGKT